MLLSEWIKFNYYDHGMLFNVSTLIVNVYNKSKMASENHVIDVCVIDFQLAMKYFGDHKILGIRFDKNCYSPIVNLLLPSDDKSKRNDIHDERD